MAEKDFINDLPAELLCYVFSNFRPKELINCRMVCTNWRNTIDSLKKNSELWRRHCRQDFKDVHRIATAVFDDTVWFSIYKSLSLWPELPSAEEVRSLVPMCGRVSDEQLSYSIFTIVDEQSQNLVVYCDTRTFQLTNYPTYTENFIKYYENSDLIIILSYQLDMFVIRKSQPALKKRAAIAGVKSLILVYHEIYYVTIDDEVCVMDLRSDRLVSKCIQKSDNVILCLGYNEGKVYLLTSQLELYYIYKKKSLLKHDVQLSTNFRQTVNEHRFVESFEWRIFFQWWYVLDHRVISLDSNLAQIRRGRMAVWDRHNFQFNYFYWFLFERTLLIEGYKDHNLKLVFRITNTRQGYDVGLEIPDHHITIAFFFDWAGGRGVLQINQDDNEVLNEILVFPIGALQINVIDRDVALFTRIIIQTLNKIMQML